MNEKRKSKPPLQMATRRPHDDHERVGTHPTASTLGWEQAGMGDTGGPPGGSTPAAKVWFNHTSSVAPSQPPFPKAPRSPGSAAAYAVVGGANTRFGWLLDAEERPGLPGSFDALVHKLIKPWAKQFAKHGPAGRPRSERQRGGAMRMPCARHASSCQTPAKGKLACTD